MKPKTKLDWVNFHIESSQNNQHEGKIEDAIQDLRIAVRELVEHLQWEEWQSSNKTEVVE